MFKLTPCFTGDDTLLAKIKEIIAGELKDSKLLLPRVLSQNLKRMLFAVANQRGEPKGVSFFVRPSPEMDLFAVTAYHVLEDHYREKSVQRGLQVFLLREDDLLAHQAPIVVEVWNCNKVDDWVVMRSSLLPTDIIPFAIGNGSEAEFLTCQLLGFNIALTDANEAEDLQNYHITHTTAMPRSVGDLKFAYVTMSQCGDSGGAVVVGDDGKVVAMHCKFLNAMKPLAKLKKLEQLRDEVSTASSQGISEGIRLDAMIKLGAFN